MLNKSIEIKFIDTFDYEIIVEGEDTKYRLFGMSDVGFKGLTDDFKDTLKSIVNTEYSKYIENGNIILYESSITEPCLKIHNRSITIPLKAKDSTQALHRLNLMLELEEDKILEHNSDKNRLSEKAMSKLQCILPVNLYSEEEGNTAEEKLVNFLNK